MKVRFLLAIGAFAGAALAPSIAAAQIGGMIGGAVNNAVQTKINNMVNCAVNDQDCINKAHAEGKPVQVVDKNGKPLKDQSAANKVTTDSSGAGSGATAGAGSNDSPGKGAWLNYDFIPGERVIFYDDFAGDHVGDLPTHEDISNGNVTVVSIKGQNYLRTANGGAMTIMLPEVLPQRFTIEFLFHRKGGNGSGIMFHVGDEGNELRFRCDQADGYLFGTGPNGPKQAGEDVGGIGENDIETCRLMVDGGYAKAYVNSTRVGQLNGLAFGRTNKIQVDLANANDDGMLLSNIRIAAGGKTMFDGLSTAGRVVTQGIFFDISSDKIRGESTPTLQQIGDMLTQHPDLKITIEGHTDNTGTAAGNQTLSEKRAASVRQYLIDTCKIDAGRLKSAGFGSSKPVASNDTQEGRQNNRRVELVKN